MKRFIKDDKCPQPYLFHLLNDSLFIYLSDGLFNVRCIFKAQAVNDRHQEANLLEVSYQRCRGIDMKSPLLIR